MKTWQEFTIAERREEAEQRMPPLINFDNDLPLNFHPAAC
jgi:hypothetical protein